MQRVQGSAQGHDRQNQPWPGSADLGAKKSNPEAVMAGTSALASNLGYLKAREAASHRMVCGLTEWEALVELAPIRSGVCGLLKCKALLSDEHLCIIEP